MSTSTGSPGPGADASAPDTEVWQRGPLEGYSPLLMPVAHTLLQVKEDLERLAISLPAEHTWVRPGGAASIGFHVRHTGGALDRLLTYARGESLSEEQRRAGHIEGDPGDPPAELGAVVSETLRLVERALEQVRGTDVASLTDVRTVGRAKLPSTVLGLLFHAAEHATRHVGQAITTARILSGTESSRAAVEAERVR